MMLGKTELRIFMLGKTKMGILMLEEQDLHAWQNASQDDES